MTRKFQFALFLLALAPACPPANGKEESRWPGWLGADRTGWVDHFEVPAKWPAKLTRIWSVPVGTGYGSPLVAGDRVFQHARQGEEEVVWGLDLATGKRLWRKSYRTPFQMGGGARKHGKGPKSSPVLADGRLFTLGITGTLSAWKADSGELLWRRDFKKRFEKPYPYWGVATSPLVDGERLFVHLGTCEAGALLALDVKTGKEIWSHDQHGHCYSSPLITRFHGVRQLVEWNHEGLAGLDPATGRLLWEYSFPHTGQNQNMPTPAIHKGRILAGGENRGMRSIEPHLQDGAWSVTENWRTREIALDMSSAIINRDLLYGFSHFKSGQLFCLDPGTGKVRWLGAGRTGENVMFLAIPGHIVALINTGELRIIAADGDAYKQVASYKVSERETWAPPVLLEDRILVKNHDTLTLWSLAGSP